MTKAEYEKKFHDNYRLTNYGLDTTIHMPCPFCAEADFMIYKVIEMSKIVRAGAICKACKRGMKTVEHTEDGSLNVEFLQTEGDDDYAAWAPLLRRA